MHHSVLRSWLILGALVVLIFTVAKYWPESAHNAQVQSEKPPHPDPDSEKKSLLMEYSTRAILAGVDPDPGITEGTASVEQIKAGISALISKDVTLVDLVNSLFANQRAFFQYEPSVEKINMEKANEIYNYIIIPDIDRMEQQAKSGGFRNLRAETSEVVFGGSFYKEWARGMMQFGVASPAKPLDKWPEDVHLQRAAGHPATLVTGSGQVIVPGMKYIQFNLIPARMLSVFLLLAAGPVHDTQTDEAKALRQLFDELEETTGIKGFGQDNSWRQWWNEHKEKDFKIFDP